MSLAGTAPKSSSTKKIFRRYGGARRVTRQAYVSEALEREARRIAQTLHDEAGQILAAVHIRLDQMTRDLPASQSAPLQDIKSMLTLVEEELRRLSHELRPSILDHLGLVPALEFLADGASKRTGVAISVEGSTEGRLPAMVETALYRIAQEALTNMGKHAHARQGRVSLWVRNGYVQCVIQDDGVGANIGDVLTRPGLYGLGLVGIRERVDSLDGTLAITSAPGLGMEIHVTLPLERAAGDKPVRIPRRGLRLVKKVEELASTN